MVWQAGDAHPHPAGTSPEGGDHAAGDHAAGIPWKALTSDHAGVPEGFDFG